MSPSCSQTARGWVMATRPSTKLDEPGRRRRCAGARAAARASPGDEPGVALGARPAPASRGGGWRRLGVRRRPPSRDGELGGLARTSFGVLQGLHMTESENVQDGDRNFPPLPAAPLARPSGPGGSVRGALDGRHSGHNPQRTHDMLHALRRTQTQTADPRTRRQEERPQATARGRPLRRAGAPPRDLAQEGSLAT